MLLLCLLECDDTGNVVRCVEYSIPPRRTHHGSAVLPTVLNGIAPGKGGDLDFACAALGWLALVAFKQGGDGLNAPDERSLSGKLRPRIAVLDLSGAAIKKPPRSSAHEHTNDGYGQLPLHLGRFEGCH